MTQKTTKSNKPATQHPNHPATPQPNNPINGSAGSRSVYNPPPLWPASVKPLSTPDHTWEGLALPYPPTGHRVSAVRVTTFVQL